MYSLGKIIKIRYRNKFRSVVLEGLVMMVKNYQTGESINLKIFNIFNQYSTGCSLILYVINAEKSVYNSTF